MNIPQTNLAAPVGFPADLRDWIEEGQLIDLILDAVVGVNLDEFSETAEGAVVTTYPPVMLLSLLVYGYATGSFSSHQIAAYAFDRDVGRFLCASLPPTFDVIEEFRQRNRMAIKRCLLRLLKLAWRVGFLRICVPTPASPVVREMVGGVVLDESLLRLFEQEVEARLRQAEQVDLESHVQIA